MIKVDESDPIGELEPSFPYRDVVIKRNVDMKDFYDLESEIGRGKFGTVYRCREKSTGLTLAAKFVGIARKQERRNVEREVEIMRSLQHPRLIQLYDAFEASNIMCVIQELITGGELFERVIDDDFMLTEKACTVFLRQICEGIAFIHSKNILHLDLKPENILCLTKTGNRIKIIDFGLARHFDPGKKLQVLFGTPEFVAPEVVNFEQIGFGTDMWSIGVICYVLLSGLSPFMGETDVETMANVTIAQYDFDDEAFDDISENAKDFIRKLLLKDKERRMTASECLSHVWLRRKPLKPISAELDKENIKNFVDRWNEQPRSPTVVNVIPTDTPTIIEKPLPAPTPPVAVVSPIETKNEKPLPTTKDELPKLPDSPKQLPVTNNTTKVENKVSKEKENNEKNLHNLKLVVTNKSNGPSSSISKQNSPVSPRATGGVKNAGDLESPNPSKQPKVDLSPVKSKALPEKSNSITSINNDKENNNHDTKKDDEIKVSTYYMPKKPPQVPNSSPKKIEDNYIHTFNLKPSPSAPNVNTLNSRIQSGRTEISISKMLTHHPQPKIAGIVLGQTLTSESKDKLPIRDHSKETDTTNKLPKGPIPKIITHKINIEGKTENAEEKKKVENGVSSSKSTGVTHVTSNETKQIQIDKGKAPIGSRVDQLSVCDRFERRSSDISCFLHDTETVDGINLAEEIRKLSTRLFQMSSDQNSVDNNNERGDYIPAACNVRDPIRQFLANHGVVTRRPKFRVSNLNRDVPIGSPPPPSNFSYYVSHMTDPSSSSEINWGDPQTHSAPQSPRTSPNRFPQESLTKDVILRLFDKVDETQLKKQSESIDSLASYFKKSNVTKKKLSTVISSK